MFPQICICAFTCCLNALQLSYNDMLTSVRVEIMRDDTELQAALSLVACILYIWSALSSTRGTGIGTLRAKARRRWHIALFPAFGK